MAVDVFGPDSESGGTGNESGRTGTGPDNHSGSPGATVIDPGSITGAADSGSADSGTGKRRRGRPAGSRNASSKKGPALDINGLEFILLSAHGMLAGITRTAELELDQPEANKIATAVVNVGRHYNMTMSAKALDWTALIMVIGEVYGTRLMAIRLRRTMERKAGGSEPGHAAGSVPPRTEPVQQSRPANGRTIIDIPGVGPVDVPTRMN